MTPHRAQPAHSIERTSGPWQTADQTQSWPHKCRRIRDANGQFIAETISDANAAFIVRACNVHDELVAALADAVEAMQYATINGHRVFAERLAHARAALAKVQS